MDHPEKLGKYRLIRLIATGGMGEVFLARQEGPAGFSKNVVIKRILRHLASDQGFVDMFLNEARLAAMIAHPNAVQIFELGKQDETYFIAMEYVHGRSLRGIKQRLLERKEVFSPILAARVCAHALQALHYAHNLKDEKGRRLNIVHRDVSPDNVLVSFDGAVKLVDFGIAKAQIGAHTTRTGTLKGKYAYMAPEQINGLSIDHRADLYSCGVLLYELLTGARPYSAATEPGLINAILTMEPEDARSKNPNLPVRMNQIIMKALAKDPAKRFNSADEMSAALESFIDESGEVLTHGHIGTFLRDLFGAAEANSDPGLVVPADGGTKALGGGTQALPVAGAGTQALTGARVVDGDEPTVFVSSPGGELAEHTEPPTHTTRARWVAAVAAVVTAAVFLGVVLWRTPPGAQGAVNAPPPSPPVAAVTAPAPAPVKPAVAEPAPEPEPAPTNIAAAAAGTQPEPAPVAAVPSPEPEREGKRAGKAEQTAARSERVQRARRAPPKPGKVALRVNPWAEVFYKGKSLGITPIAPVELPAGKQLLVLKNAELGKQRKVSVNIQPGGETQLKVDMFE